MLLKNCAYIITQNKKREILTNCDILINKNKIEAIGKDLKSSDEKTIDCSKKAVLPGLINSHTHIAMTLFRALADDLPLEEWLNNKIWPMEAKLTPELVKTGSLLGCAEAIKSGTTCFLDMYHHEQAVAEATAQASLRAILCPVYFDFNPSPFNQTKNLIKQHNKTGFKNQPIKFALSPHAPYTCSKELLQQTADFANKHNIQIHIHISETQKEIQDLKKKYKKLPVEHLEDTNLLSNKTLAAHSIHLTEKEIQIFAKNNVNILHCPTSNMKLSSGTLPLKKMQEQKINISLGTDSAASNNNLDMFEEMKFCALLHKHTNPTNAPSQQILDMATTNAAKALQINSGSIEQNKNADIITINLKQPHLTPIHSKKSIISHLVYSAQSSDTTDSIVNGNLLMKNRQLLTLNENKILEQAENAKQELQAALEN